MPPGSVALFARSRLMGQRARAASLFKFPAKQNYGTLAAAVGLHCGGLPASKKPTMSDGSGWTHGPAFEAGGIRFRLWAPAEKRVSIVLEKADAIAMERREDGFFEALVEGAPPTVRSIGLSYRMEYSRPIRRRDSSLGMSTGRARRSTMQVIPGERIGADAPGTTRCCTNCMSGLSRRKAPSSPPPRSSTISLVSE
jgi:hypothetical protein